jgi:hypothetical protein
MGNQKKSILSYEAFFEAKRVFNTKSIYLDTDTPLSDTDVVTVYHGFYSRVDAFAFAKYGFSGEENASRVYSYEYGNNPNGLFVSIDFKVAKEFASSGIIMQASVPVSHLEAPVWVGGRGHYGQGEYTQSFNTADEREAQRIANRERAKGHRMQMVSQSDRPELAETLFDNSEKQALYTGHMNPNMIKGFWVNDSIYRDRRRTGSYAFHSRAEFLTGYFSEDEVSSVKDTYIGTRRIYPQRYEDRINKLMLPNDTFTTDRLMKVLQDRYGDDAGLYYDDMMDDLRREYSEYRKWFHPKQLKVIDELVKSGKI